MTLNGSASSVRPRPRPPRREFVTTVCTEDLGRHSGSGLTLDQVIAEELRNVGDATGTPIEECDDLVIWERNKVAALIRLGSDHRPVVTRFDPPAAPEAVPVAGVVAGENEAGDTGAEGSCRALALELTRATIAQYQATKRVAVEIDARSQDTLRLTNPGAAEPTPPWESWTTLAREATTAAERHLFQCILALNGQDPNRSDPGDPGSHRPPCGVAYDGRLYLALAGAPGTTPVVIDRNHVVCLDPRPGDSSRGAP